MNDEFLGTIFLLIIVILFKVRFLETVHFAYLRKHKSLTILMSFFIVITRIKELFGH